jgi:hypothetical protein
MSHTSAHHSDDPKFATFLKMNLTRCQKKINKVPVDSSKQLVISEIGKNSTTMTFPAKYTKETI